jgi:hypothetical protein
MNTLTLQYKQLGAYADYVIKQNNIVTEKDNLIYETEQVTELSMDIISISSGFEASIRIVFGDVIYQEKNPTPLFLKEYTDILSDIFKKAELRVDSKGHIISVENLKEMEDN